MSIRHEHVDIGQRIRRAQALADMEKARADHDHEAMMAYSDLADDLSEALDD